MSEIACKTCAHWRRNKPCEVPPEPDTHTRFLGIRVARDDYMVRIDRYVRNAVIQRNESGFCYRHPKSFGTHETHWCAEHKNAPALSTPTHKGEEG